LDVVALKRTLTGISVSLGNGDGTLQSPVSYPVGSQLLGIAVGDFNGDGRTDLALADYPNNCVRILLGM
jgi:FG-GAP-like repeat